MHAQKKQTRKSAWAPVVCGSVSAVDEALWWRAADDVRPMICYVHTRLSPFFIFASFTGLENIPADNLTTHRDTQGATWHLHREGGGKLRNSFSCDRSAVAGGSRGNPWLCGSVACSL